MSGRRIYGIPIIQVETVCEKISFVPPFLKKCIRGSWLFNGGTAIFLHFLRVQTIWLNKRVKLATGHFLR